MNDVINIEWENFVPGVSEVNPKISKHIFLFHMLLKQKRQIDTNFGQKIDETRVKIPKFKGTSKRLYFSKNHEEPRI